MANAIQVPYYDVLVEMQQQPRLGLATKRLADWMNAVTSALPTFQPLVATDFGAAGNATSDDTVAVQKAVDQAAAQGGGTIIFPSGTFSIGTVTMKAGEAPISLVGQGESTILKRRAVLADGKGMLDIFGSHVTLDSLVLDGDVTTPAGLLYNVDFTGIGANDPMATSLTKGSSVWVHGGANDFSCRHVTFTHSSGYACLIDARSGGISDVRIIDCIFSNNRPTLFGTVAGQENYGSWNGCLFVSGDGRPANPGCVLKRFMVAQCRFLRNTGNCIWSHELGLSELHEEFLISENTFVDCGLDAIEIGGVIGGVVVGNSGRRIGYITTDDTGQSNPRWLPGVNATAIDSSGLVKSVLFVANSFVSVAGGALDLDSHCLSTVANNSFRTPYPDEPEYDQDQIAVSGPLGGPSAAYGVNGNNSSQTPHGATGLNIVGNTFINLRAGSVRLFAARKCFVSGNNILAPADSIYPPMGMGPVGPGPYQRCYDNRVSGNKIDYNPVPSAPAIIEDDTYSAFLPAETNAVFNNCPITPAGTLATEFKKSPTSGSVHYLETPWFV